tara:strand:+ start:605 stop:733 length:129 start_codon:yes stop_codon:yes gene_type:complete
MRALVQTLHLQVAGDLEMVAREERAEMLRQIPEVAEETAAQL